jgi:PAS domain S-box-containing protein
VAKIMETSPIGIVALDRQGEITFANAEAEHVLGLTRNGAAGHRYEPPGWPNTDYEGRPFPDEELPFRRVMATGQPLYDIRHTIENASGERIYLSINAAPVLGENGKPDGVIESFEDVSERRRAEEERRLLEAELLQSQKMEAVGRLAGGVAHNFNNLLTAITGYSELLLARLPADSELHPDVSEIRRASERAAEVARQLLLFSRRERGQRERLDLNDAIREMWTLLRQLIRSDIEMATVLADDLDRIESDRSQIEQVLVNLVVNASDAMPDGGKLTIETANLRLAEPRLTCDLSLPAGNFVTLTVRDSGHGMDEETQARIFEPFYTTKGPDRGTGLGLSTVYGIIEENEGHIFVESELDQGSTFTIFLPAGES